MMWLIEFISGISGVGYYKNENWDSPYSLGRFMFLNFIFQNQEFKKEIILFNIDDKNQKFRITLNKTNLIKYGKDLISKLLMNIHISKCIGDVESGKNLIKKYAMVDDYMAYIYDMIPFTKNIEKQMNLDLIMDEKDGKKEIKIDEYPSTALGFIKSVVDRFKCDYNEITYKQWTKYYNPFETK